MDIIDYIARHSSQAGPHYIGLVQGDVAYYFTNGGNAFYPTPHADRRSVSSLVRAFPEYLFIYSEDSSPGRDYATHLRSWEALYVGSLGSGTLITASNVLPILDGNIYEPTEHPAIQSSSFLQALSDMEEGADDGPARWGGVTVSSGIPSRVRGRLGAGRGELLTLTESQARHIANAFSQFYSTEEKTFFINGSARRCRLVKTPALLISGKWLPKEIAEAVRDFFHTLDEDEGNRDSPALSMALAKLPSDLRKDLLSGLAAYKGERLDQQILPQHRSVANLRTDGAYPELWILFISFAIFLALVARALRQLKASHALLGISPLVTGPMAAAFCLAWLHFCLFVVFTLEYRFYMNYGTDVVSPFIRFNYSELFPMVARHIASAFSSQDLFPANRLAQITWLSIPLMLALGGFAGTVHILMPPLFRYVKRNLQKGDDVKLENHIVVCNWHPHAENVVRQLQAQARLQGRDQPRILVITSDLDNVSLPDLGKRTDEKFGEYRLFAVPPRTGEDPYTDDVMRVLAISADPKSSATLNLVRVDSADTAIIFPDSNADDPDSSTALIVLAIQQLSGHRDKPKIIVWCADSNNVGIFLDERFRLTDVCSTEWAWRVICQATSVPHVSNVYRRLMTSSEDTNEFYELTIPDSAPEMMFGSVQQMFLEYNKECGRISRSIKRRNTVLPVGYSEKDDDRRVRIHINPEPEERVGPGDHLLLLTYKMDDRIKRKLVKRLREGNGIAGVPEG